MNDVMRALNETIQARKTSNEEGSYTRYLFREGINKILKKVGEECSETIIASKSLEADVDNTEKKADLENEICDLLYHLLVLMSAQNIPLSDIEEILAERAQKTGNKKSSKTVDKNS